MLNKRTALYLLRQRTGLSQQEFAKKIFVSQGQYQKYEAGDKPLSIDLLIRISALLHLPPAILLQCLVMGIEAPESSIYKAIEYTNNAINMDVFQQQTALLKIWDLLQEKPELLSTEIEKILRIHGFSPPEKIINP